MLLAQDGWRDLDFLGAMIHGRRSGLAEAARLDELCRLRSVEELVHALTSDEQIRTVVALQRRLVADLAEELSEMSARVGGVAGGLIEWLRLRLHAENLKVLSRGWATWGDPKEIQANLIPLAHVRLPEIPAVLAADSPEGLARLIDLAPLRQGVLKAADAYRRSSQVFFIETGIDHGYLKELMTLAKSLPDAEGEDTMPLVRQEVDLFHLMLATRGRFLYDLKADLLAPFHVPGDRLVPDVFAAILSAHDLNEVAERALHHVIDTAPAAQAQHGETRALEPVDLEVLGWTRYYRLANRVMRRSHMGIGAVMGYVAVRRVELANLITLSEGVRLAAAPEGLRRRLIPQAPGEAARV